MSGLQNFGPYDPLPTLSLHLGASVKNCAFLLQTFVEQKSKEATPLLITNLNDLPHFLMFIELLSLK